MGPLPSILAPICALLVPAALCAQFEPEAQPADVPFSHLHTLLERTFLKIDILALDVCVDAPTAQRIGAALSESNPRDAADAITSAMLVAPLARSRIRVLRNIGLDQFVDGVVTEQRKAVQAGLLDDSTHQAVRAALPEWFSVLRDRGLRRGDEIVYAFRADTVRTTYVGANGDILLRHTATGWQRRTSVLATYFAPGSSFRDGLIESLDHRGPGRRSRPCGEPHL